MIKKIRDDVWKISFDSNCYLIGDILIDTCPRCFMSEFAQELGSLIDLTAVRKVMFTHLHYDHCGNADLFPNATIYASSAAIEDYSKNKAEAVLGDAPDLKLELLESFDGFQVISVPGHTRGSVAILYKDLLFSGDTWFGKGCHGRTDLPTSVPAEMEASLEKLKKLKFKLLCPGHDYT